MVFYWRLAFRRASARRTVSPLSTRVAVRGLFHAVRLSIHFAPRPESQVTVTVEHRRIPVRVFENMIHKSKRKVFEIN